jgi:glycosyltransferase involved in cell wall biosynthesis
VALFVTHSPVAGGAELVLATYLRHRPGVHQVLVLADGECSAMFADVGARVTTLPVFGSDEPGRMLSAADAAVIATRVARRLPAILDRVRRSGEPVVITNSMKAHVLAPAIAATGRRVGLRLHDDIGHGSTSPAAVGALRIAATASASTAAVSRAAALSARGAHLPRVRWFHNGVEPGEPRGHDHRGPLRLLTLAQLAPWKGVGAAIEAVAAARRRGDDVTLDIAGAAIFGDRGHPDELRALALRLDLNGAVKWHGHIADPAPLLRTADVLLHLPTAPDPLPTAVLEAQAWSLPVIGRDLGGMAEIVDDGGSGLLTRSADPAVVADLIARLSDPDTLGRMGRAARRRAETRFSAAEYAQRFDDWITAVGTA